MAMQRLVERQKKLIADWKEKHPKECAENPDAYKEADELRAFVIFDDVISDKVAMQWNEFINSFFVEGRHLCISVFITTQHVKGIGPMLRGNLDVAILQPIFQHEARMTLADLYAGKIILFYFIGHFLSDFALRIVLTCVGKLVATLAYDPSRTELS